MNDPIRLIIADDHPIFRRGLREIVEAEPGFAVVAECADGAAALAAIAAHEPDVAVLDLDMPGLDGFEVARAAQEKNLATNVVILTMHNSEPLFNEALNVGVRGYVLKEVALTDIVDCLRAVAAGRSHISAALSSYLVNRLRRAGERARGGAAALTPSEQKILRLIAAEKTSRQIADELFISVRTVDRHRANICQKLDLRGTNALVRFALAHKSEL